MADYSYLGSGKVYIREIGGTTGLIEAGNASQFDFKVNETSKSVADYTQAGGGTFNEVKRIESVEATLTFNELNVNNLARGLFGATSSVTSQAVTNEAVVVNPSAFSRFAYMPSGSVTPTLTTPGSAATARANTTAYALNAYAVPATSNGYYYKATTAGTSGASIPTYPTTIGATVTDGSVVWTCAGKTAPVAGTDYEIRGGGVFAYNTLAGETWTLNYTRAATDVLQALTTSSKEYEIIFDGVNEARAGKKVLVHAYRVKLGAAQNVSWIGDDYASLQLTGKVLKDTSKTGAGISQYFKAELET